MNRNHKNLLIDLLIDKVKALETEILEMKQAERERLAVLRRGQIREVGYYFVTTPKGKSRAKWNGSSWEFDDRKVMGGILEVTDA